MPLDRTLDYNEYKTEIDRIHVMFRHLIKTGISKGRPGFYADKFLVDSYPIDEEAAIEGEGIEGARKRYSRTRGRPRESDSAGQFN